MPTSFPLPPARYLSLKMGHRGPAGARCVEHGSEIDDETAALMAAVVKDAR
jgi:hypothetical protein